MNILTIYGSNCYLNQSIEQSATGKRGSSIEAGSELIEVLINAYCQEFGSIVEKALDINVKKACHIQKAIDKVKVT